MQNLPWAAFRKKCNYAYMPQTENGLGWSQEQNQASFIQGDTDDHVKIKGCDRAAYIFCEVGLGKGLDWSINSRDRERTWNWTYFKGQDEVFENMLDIGCASKSAE